MLCVRDNAEHSWQLEPDGQLLPLDQSAASPPGIKRTWFFALVGSLYERWAHPSTTTGAAMDDLEEETDLDDTTDEASDGPSSGVGNGGALNGRTAATKAGGRRRKGLKRR